MSKNPSAEIVSRALQKCYYTPFSDEEFDYILLTSLLSDTERRIWLYLVKRSRGDKDYSVVFRLGQLASFFSLNSRTIDGLVIKRFLRKQHDADRRVTVYFVQLDENGLQKVWAAKKQTKLAHAKQFLGRIGYA